MPYGVSNSFNRGMMKTYSRRSKGTGPRQYPSTTRVIIRMDENGRVKEEIIPSLSDGSDEAVPIGEPSSPVSTVHHTFSDAAPKTTASPPSSPPPSRSTPPPKAHKPMFSFLKRKRTAADDGGEPLGETSPNISGTQRAPPKKRTRHTQMQIDLGGGVNKTCKDCGMEYVPANKEDEALHKEFHNLKMRGVVLGKAFVKEHEALERYAGSEIVIAVDARSSLASRKKAQRVLEVVRSDLGATEITEERLWSTKYRMPLKSSEGEKCLNEPEKEDPQYKVFMYMAGDLCVGLCLVERISSSYKVVDPDARQHGSHSSAITIESSSIRAETSTDAILLGISRIWTAKSHRGLKVATTLLDKARFNFFYGIEVPKKMVAFSQPTESGGHLARKWFGSDVGWHVYAHSD